jgi:ubiquinone/menaquinone biosynthesis C-methylase UbiE
MDFEKVTYKLGQNLLKSAPNFKRFLWRIWYNFIINVDSETELLFMNYGYEEIGPNGSPQSLKPAEEKYRYRINLYNHIAQGVEMQGKQVLEVGCGCGGGAAYIATHFDPATYKGLDYSKSAVEACQKYHTAVPNLTFVHGNAEALPFESASFDIVVNVESSHTYGNPSRFFSEVDRVLRPGGYFLIADFRDKQEVSPFRQQLHDAHFQFLQENDITPNVVKALELDSERKIKLIPPGILRNAFNVFSGTTNSIMYKTFARGETEYLFFVLQKGISQ